MRATHAVLAVAAVGVCLWLVWNSRWEEPFNPETTSVALSGTGRWIAAGTAKGWVALWDRTAARSVRRFRAESGRLNDLQFSPDEQWLAVATRELELISVAMPSQRRGLRSDHRNYGAVRFSPDGGRLMVTAGDEGIEILDARSGERMIRVCCSTVGGDAAFNADGSLFASAGHRPRIWNSSSGALVAALTEEREFFNFRPVVFDEGGNRILMGSQDGRVYAWDARSYRLVAVSRPHPGWVDTIAVQPKTGWIAYAAFGKPIRMWRPDGEERELRTPAPASNIAFTPDGGALVFGTAKGNIEYWDAEAGRRILSTPSWLK